MHSDGCEGHCHAVIVVSGNADRLSGRSCLGRIHLIAVVGFYFNQIRAELAEV